MTIRTTHVGSLPRTPELIEANRARREGSLGDADFTSLLQDQVDGVVKRQAEIGLDIVNDGEYGHAMIDTVDYGAWWTYSFSRFGGLSFENSGGFELRPPAGRDGRLAFSSFAERRDWQRFADAYGDPESGSPRVRRGDPVGVHECARPQDRCASGRVSLLVAPGPPCGVDGRDRRLWRRRTAVVSPGGYVPEAGVFDSSSRHGSVRSDLPLGRWCHGRGAPGLW